MTTKQLVTAGTLLVRESTVLPPSVHLNADGVSGGWNFFRVGAELLQLKSALLSAGWNYFYLSSIEQTSLGRAGAWDAAMKGLTVKMQRENCTGMQIDKVASLSFWGVPYVKVSAHCCQIQNSNLLVDGPDDRTL